MQDLTEKFFKEINNSKEILFEELKIRDSEPIKLKGKCAVIARKEKKHITRLEKVIHNAGMKPVIIQSEKTKNAKYVEKKLHNLDILISHKRESFYHIFQGDEKDHWEKFLGEKGIFIATKWSNKIEIPPVQILEKLFTYIRKSQEFIHLHNSNNEEYSTIKIMYPEDISSTKEFKKILNTNEFSSIYNIQLTVVEPKKFHMESYSNLKVISKKEFLNNTSNDGDNQVINNKFRYVKFTFYSNKNFNNKQIKKIEENLNQIYKLYNNFLYTSKVQIFSPE